jgi:hypothetical protein
MVFAPRDGTRKAGGPVAVGQGPPDRFFGIRLETVADRGFEPDFGAISVIPPPFLKGFSASAPM